jgi:hypothetical protein
MPEANTLEVVLCSKCFTNQGLRLDADRILGGHFKTGN